MLGDATEAIADAIEPPSDVAVPVLVQTPRVEAAVARVATEVDQVLVGAAELAEDDEVLIVGLVAA